MSKPFETHIVMDDSSKKYKIIHISKKHINIYNSSSRSWKCISNPSNVHQEESERIYDGLVYITTIFTNGNHVSVNMKSTKFIKLSFSVEYI